VGPESELKAQVKAILTDAGWEVFDLSTDRKERRQHAGLPDLIIVRNNVVVFVETKAPGERLRESQVEFWRKIYPHLGPNVGHAVIDNVLAAKALVAYYGG